MDSNAQGQTQAKRYYIMTTERTTYTKYLIEQDGETPLDDYDGEYLGYVDGETTGHEYSEAFPTEQEALSSDDGYTEGQ
jgi:hypothetical protein